MGALDIVVAVALSCCLSVAGWQPIALATAQSPPLPDCSTALGSVIDCLDFVTGQSAVPTKECCTGVLDLHLHKPACLCELALDSNDTRAIPGFKPELSAQLPASCNIQNASISNCPALLGQVPTNATSPVSAAVAPATTIGGQRGAASQRIVKSAVDTVIAVAMVSFVSFRVVGPIYIT